MKNEWNFHQGSLETSITCCPQDNLRLPVGRQGSLAGAEEDLPEISVFPNPSNGAVHLRLAQWPGGSYSLHNSLGQPVAQAALAATSHEQVFNLALPHLPNGLYFLTLRNTQGKMLGSKRLIIMRE
jgi:hypothetical protein